MKKVINTLLFIIFSLSFISCGDDLVLTDYAQVYFYMEVYNDKGENLLDPDNPNNIIGTEIGYNTVPGYMPRKVAWERITGDNDGWPFTYLSWYKSLELYNIDYIKSSHRTYRITFSELQYTCDFRIVYDGNLNAQAFVNGVETPIQEIHNDKNVGFDCILRLIIPSGDDTSATIN